MIDVSDNLYELLEVSPFATQEEIKSAYFAVAKKYHPDVYHGPDAQQRFQKINAAYEVLKDPNQRLKYDSFINTVKSTRSSSSETSFNHNPDREEFNSFQDPVDPDHNYYTELDLELFASLECVKTAFKNLSEKYDPKTSHVPNARQKFRRVTIAYKILSDAEMKECYDYLLRILVNNYPKKTSESAQSSNNRSDTTNKSTTVSSDETSSSKSGVNNSRRFDYDTDSQYTTANESGGAGGCYKILFCLCLFLVFLAIMNSCGTDNNSTRNSQSSFSRVSTSIKPTSTPAIRRTVRPTVKPTIKPTQRQLHMDYSQSTSVAIIHITQTSSSARNKTSTPTPAPTWSFEKEELSIKKGQTVEFHFTTPPYATFTYLLEQVGIVTVSYRNKGTLILNGFKPGVVRLFLRDSYNQIVATCTITVTD